MPIYLRPWDNDGGVVNNRMVKLRKLDSATPHRSRKDAVTSALSAKVHCVTEDRYAVVPEF